MDRTIKKLKTAFWAFPLLALIFVVAYETDLLLPGGWQDMEPKHLFIVSWVMELLTMAMIPAALFLFKIPRVNRQLEASPVRALHRWGMVRQYMLGLPMLANTLLYYQCMDVLFLYLAIMLLIAMFFVYPSRSLYESIMEEDEQEQ